MSTNTQSTNPPAWQMLIKQVMYGGTEFMNQLKAENHPVDATPQHPRERQPKEIVQATPTPANDPEHHESQSLEIDPAQIAAIQHRLESKIFGQKAAVDALCSALKTRSAGLHLEGSEKPITTALFIGPSGVGKTEVCKVLAESLALPNEPLSKTLKKIDMGDYAQPVSAGSFVGAGAGLAECTREGRLTETVSQEPGTPAHFKVVLLDEIDKADPLCFDALLPVFDVGSVVNNKNKPVSFRNALLILTSNIGQEAESLRMLPDENDKSSRGDGLTWQAYLADYLAACRRSVRPVDTGFVKPAQQAIFAALSVEAQKEVIIQREYMAALRNPENGLRPEFLNRIQVIVIFKPLSTDLLRKITRKVCQSKSQAFAKKHGDTPLIFSESFIQRFTVAAEDAPNGGRPIARLMETVTEPLGLVPWLTDVCEDMQTPKMQCQAQIAKGEAFWVDLEMDKPEQGTDSASPAIRLTISAAPAPTDPNTDPLHRRRLWASRDLRHALNEFQVTKAAIGPSLDAMDWGQHGPASDNELNQEPKPVKPQRTPRKKRNP